MKNIISTIGKIIVTALFFSSIFSVESIAQEASNCDVVGRWAEGSCFAVTADEHIVYYGNGGLLEILDITDAENPIKLSEYVCNGRIEGIEVVDDIAYLVGGRNGFLKVLDVSNPEMPWELSALPMPTVNDIKIQGEYAYISADETGLIIVNISDPMNPGILSSTKLEGAAEDAVVVGDYVYVVTSYYGWSVVRIINKGNPEVVASHEAPGTYRGIDYLNSQLYMAGGTEGLVVFDLVDWNPVPTNAYHVEGHAEDVVVKEGIAYVANRYRGIYLLDVSDPLNLVELGKLNTRRAAAIAVESDNALVADTWSFKVIDISDSSQPEVKTNIEMTNDLTDIAIQGDYIYTANIYAGMNILDVSDPSEIHVTGSRLFTGTHLDMAVQDTLAFMAGGSSGLTIMSVNDPQLPFTLYQRDFDNSTNCLDVQDNYVFAGVYEEGMYIFDIEDPSNPTQTGFVGFDYPTDRMKAVGDYIYIACREKGWRIFDVSDKSNPVEIGSIETEIHARNISFDGMIGIGSEGALGLRILDVSDPANPIEIATFNTSGAAYDAVRKGNYVYAADGNEGLRIIDISDLTDLKEVAYYLTGERAIGVEIGDSEIYVADDEDGIYVLQFDSLSVSVKEIFISSGPNLIKNIGPNPAVDQVSISINVKQYEPVRINIHNVNGVLVETVTNAKLQPGDYTFKWNRMSNKSNPVDAGLYLVEVQIGDKRQVAQVVIVE